MHRHGEFCSDFNAVGIDYEVWQDGKIIDRYTGDGKEARTILALYRGNFTIKAVNKQLQQEVLSENH